MYSFLPKNGITQITKIPDYSTTDESKHIIVHVKLSRSGSHELKHLRDEIIGFYGDGREEYLSKQQRVRVITHDKLSGDKDEYGLVVQTSLNL